jgi:outer membrane receptor for ferrienterochelin and colicins
MRRSRRAGLLRAGVAIGFLAFAVPAVSQSQVDQDLMSMNLEDLSRVKVFSASRHFEDARRAPSSVSIITAADIRHNGWRTLGDALESLRGFYISYDRLYPYLGVRGFMRPGDDNSRILLLIDGHRLNENAFDSAYIGTAFSLDLDLVDHIEIVRGPGSSLFGTNALFGVINVITRSAGTEAVIETSGDTGSFRSRTGRVTLATGKGNRSGLFSASYLRDPGQASLFFPSFDSPSTNNGYAVNMDGTRVDSVFADLRSGSFRLQGTFSDNLKKFPTGTFGTLFNNPLDWQRDVRGYVDASLHKTAWSGTDIDLRVFYDAYDNVGSGGFQVPWFLGTAQAYEKARADWVGAEANLTREVGPHRITVGADYESSLRILQRDEIVGMGDLSRVNDTPWLAAVYGDAELNFTPRLIVHAGGRYDQYSTFGGAVSPRLALVYLPGTRTAVKYIVGTAFRAPSAYEQFYNDPVNILLPPVKLQPERILTNELVLEQYLRPWVSVTVDGYYNELHQLMEQVPAGATGMTWFVNAGRVHALGLETELAAERKSGMGVRISYTVSSATDAESNMHMANSPVSQVKFNGKSPLSRYGFASLEFFYVSAMTDDQGTRVPCYVLPNVTVNTNSMWGGWVFSSSMYNATNRRWFSPASPNTPEDQIQQDGRTWRFKVTYRVPLNAERSRR